MTARMERRQPMSLLLLPLAGVCSSARIFYTHA